MPIPNEVIDELINFRDNYRTFNRIYKDLQGHTWEYVAIGNGKVLGYGKDRKSLMKKYRNVKGVFIELIIPQDIIWTF